MGGTSALLVHCWFSAYICSHFINLEVIKVYRISQKQFIVVYTSTLYEISLDYFDTEDLLSVLLLSRVMNVLS